MCKYLRMSPLMELKWNNVGLNGAFENHTDIWIGSIDSRVKDESFIKPGFVCIHLLPSGNSSLEIGRCVRAGLTTWTSLEMIKFLTWRQMWIICQSNPRQLRKWRLLASFFVWHTLSFLEGKAEPVVLCGAGKQSNHKFPAQIPMQCCRNTWVFGGGWWPPRVMTHLSPCPKITPALQLGNLCLHEPNHWHKSMFPHVSGSSLGREIGCGTQQQPRSGPLLSCSTSTLISKELIFSGMCCSFCQCTRASLGLCASTSNCYVSHCWFIEEWRTT